MANFFKSYFKKLFSDLHSIILGLIIGAFVLSVGGIWILSNKLWNILISYFLYPTPLWVTGTILLLLILVYILLRKKTLIPFSSPDPNYLEKYHVFWDKENRMRCLNCGKPLKASSKDDDPSIFYCCGPECNVKHVLKDEQGNKLTEQQAIEILNKR